ncbi:MAG: Cephalosporin-C deacetylase [Pseudonocardiales bacterium]|nr:Cephalosporin-C deacetylase [Pseudonocardiales bacterium]
MRVDLPLEQLRTYSYALEEPDDFDEFWRATIREHASGPLNIRQQQVDCGLRTIDAVDLTYAGYAGSDVRAWVLRPSGHAGRLPVIVEYPAYGSGRGLPVESLAYASAGFVHVLLDARGQGSITRAGDTPDGFGSAPAVPGFMTRGLLDREEYYFRRLYVDAYRLIDVVQHLDGVDTDRITVTGRSQGGALCLVAAGLRDDIALAVPHVPFLCAFQRALEITDRDPFDEIGRWLATHRTMADEALATLRYFDGVSFAQRATCPARFCVGLHDLVSPPSTVFAAYNAYSGPRDMTVWRYNGHEAGGPQDLLRTIAAARSLGTDRSEGDRQ